MNLHHHIVDDFLEDFANWRDWADGLTYSDALNPQDGVSYPGIYRDVPTFGLTERVRFLLQQNVSVTAAFLRLSLADVPVPQQAHADGMMGRFSLMVYMNRTEDCAGGTAFCRHITTGMERSPTDEAQLNILHADQNLTGAWTDYMISEMRPNRAVLFDANLIHRALPIGGFGDSPRNGRLVLTAFFQ